MREPPFPPDTRAKGWRLEIDHERIDQSDTWALAKPEVRPWLLMLWLVAWKQTPCGSLPVGDDLIAARIGMPRASFAKHRDVLMRGWWEATDGRQYHDVLAQRAIEMLDARAKNSARAAKRRGTTQDNADTHDAITGMSRVTTPRLHREFDTGTGRQRKEKEPPVGPPEGDKPKRACALPADFQPDATGEALAAKLGVDLAAELPKFCDHHRARGSTMKDWQAAWRTWARNAVRFGARSAPSAAAEPKPWAGAL